jgi:hypothetical protein
VGKKEGGKKEVGKKDEVVQESKRNKECPVCLSETTNESSVNGCTHKYEKYYYLVFIFL